MMSIGTPHEGAPLAHQNRTASDKTDNDNSGLLFTHTTLLNLNMNLKLRAMSQSLLRNFKIS